LTEVRKRQLAWVAGISAVIALLAVWTFAIDWEWSYIGDDVRIIQTIRRASTEGGPFGVIATAFTYAKGDLGDFFRPVSSFYPFFIYQFSPEIARGIRLIFLLVAFASVLRLTLRRGVTALRNPFLIWVTALLLANTSLYHGLWAPSVQELTGVFLLSLFLLINNVYLRAALLVLVALTKEPFIWLPLIYAFYVYFTDKRTKFAIGLGAVGTALVALLLRAYNSGGYVSGRLDAFNPWRWHENLTQLFGASALFFLVLIVGLLVLKNELTFSRQATLMGAFSLSYLLSLMPFSTVGYFSGPGLFMGAAFAACLTPKALKPGKTSWAQMSPLLIALLLSALATVEFLRAEVFGRNTMVVELRDWVIGELPSGKSLGLINLSINELGFIISEKDPTAEPLLVAWFPETQVDYIFVGLDASFPPGLTDCPATYVWTKGFLAPLKC